MKKKLVLLGLGIFLLIFLIWPSYYPDQYTSDTIQTYTCGSIRGDIPGNHFCLAPGIHPRLGGGLKYVTSKIHKDNDKLYGDNDTYWFKDQSDFDPNNALKFSFLIAFFVTSVLTLVYRRKLYTKKQ